MSPYAAQLIGEPWGHGEDKNKAGACTEVSAVDQLVRQGIDPSRIKFIDALRPRIVYENGKIVNDAYIKPCENCKISWSKGTK
ncbi:hypothetical protein RFH42_09195 [Acinetobacter rudis]|uniref:hypothetical protein n=1 Tax=Acinetobacter rudis TaxID=632955 RepID=UPI00280CD2A7|nr:hypothetical protein [Acinetobacter rudis]MDQ8953134.1 hypothetical protein [Acinetobacter rudis]